MWEQYQQRQMGAYKRVLEQPGYRGSREKEVPAVGEGQPAVKSCTGNI